MKIANWLRPRTATVEELREQLASAAKAHEDAAGAVVSAQQAFDDSSSDAAANAAANALSKARQSAEYAEEHVGRAQRLLDAAEAKRAAEERAKLQAKYDALKAEIEGPDTVGAELIAREAGAWLAPIEIRAQRHQHADARNQKRRELEAMSQRLGHAPGGIRYEEVYGVQVAERVEARVAEVPMGPVRDLVFGLARFLAASGRFGFR